MPEARGLSRSGMLEARRIAAGCIKIAEALCGFIQEREEDSGWGITSHFGEEKFFLTCLQMGLPPLRPTLDKTDLLALCREWI